MILTRILSRHDFLRFRLVAELCTYIACAIQVVCSEPIRVQCFWSANHYGTKPGVRRATQDHTYLIIWEDTLRKGE